MSTLAPTLLTPYGYSSGTCGYCSPNGERSKGKTSTKYGMVTSQMSPQYYQGLIDRGWRRSGEYLYHPDMATTCCPQYTIRLSASSIKVTKRQRQVIKRFNRFLETGQRPGESQAEVVMSNKNIAGQDRGDGRGKGKGKANQLGVDDVFDELHAFEAGQPGASTGKHRFETQLVNAEPTAETFELYKAYQVSVHKDKPGECSMRGFSRFLCGDVLTRSPVRYNQDVSAEITARRLPEHYGQYHLLYRIDSLLVGISVIDILPASISSVYFIWHPDWAWASLGKLSALHEVSLARRMRVKGVEAMCWSYMGYWIPGCQKMVYKSDYSPSELLDPGTNIFHPLDTALESYLLAHPRGYHPFETSVMQGGAPAHSEGKGGTTERDRTGLIDAKASADEEMDVDSSEDAEDDEEDEEESMSAWPSHPPPGFRNPREMTNETVQDVLILLGKGKSRKLVPVSNLQFGDERAVYGEIKEFIAAVGEEYIARTGHLGRPGDKAILHFG
ncbi:hypothetical protein IAU60_001651 [Kwoniella sp. DSM 27419]